MSQNRSREDQEQYQNRSSTRTGAYRFPIFENYGGVEA